MRAGDGGGSFPSFWGTADHHAGRGSPAPVTGHLLLTIAEQRLESASAEDHPEAKWRLDFIVRNAGDRLYDIKCPGGHYTLKTAPEITRAIRRAAGDQVSLA